MLIVNIMKKKNSYQVCLRRWNDIKTTKYPTLYEKDEKTYTSLPNISLVQKIFIEIKIITDGKRQYFVSHIV